ncbi:MAG: galactokinase [Phycisphaerales bacterium]|nr:galactokinase [Phycisphaerales bacterium]
MPVPTLDALLTRAKEHFAVSFDKQPTVLAAAPGRVNLIGEHTDYNLGWSLPIAIDRHTVIAAAPTDEPTSTLIAMDVGESVSVDLTKPTHRDAPAWANYLLGVAKKMMPDDGVNTLAVMTSSVPIGAGLSSSAALEVAFATALLGLTGEAMERIELARRCQRAENDFVGVPCGLMDQLVSSCAREGCAALIDFQTGDVTHIPLPDPDTLAILVADTGVKHDLAQSAYADRRRECEQAAQALGVDSLRKATVSDLLSHKNSLDPILFSRAWHVIGENARVDMAVDALKAGDLPAFGRLMHQSHASLRDQYEVSCPELDTLVELAEHFTGHVYGSRLTGAGFGGCTVTLCPPDIAGELTNYLQDGYRERHGSTPTVHHVTPGCGAMLIEPE